MRGTSHCPLCAAFSAAPARNMGSLFGRVAALRALLCGPRFQCLLVRPSSGESCARGELGGWPLRGLCLRTCGSQRLGLVPEECKSNPQQPGTELLAVESQSRGGETTRRYGVTFPPRSSCCPGIET